MQMLKTKTRFLSILLCSLVLFSCGKEPDIAAEELVSVTIKNLSELVVEYNFKRPAQVISINDSTLSTELNAPVAFIHAHVGDLVKKGAPLIELNCSDERNRLQQASAQLAASKASTKLSELNYQRGQQLLIQKTISEQEMNRLESEFDRAKANQASALAAYKLSKHNVSKCIIRAPFNATVMERSATVGQLATQGMPMIRLVDSDNLEVSAYLVNHEAEIIKQSTSIYFLYNNKKYPLEIRALTAAVDSIRRTQEIRLRFKNEKPIAGSSGELVWQHPSPALPTEYLSQRNGVLGHLYADNISDDNTAEVAFITIDGAREGQPAPINTDISSDTAVLIDGRFGVEISQKIQILPLPGN